VALREIIFLIYLNDRDVAWIRYCAKGTGPEGRGGLEDKERIGGKEILVGAFLLTHW